MSIAKRLIATDSSSSCFSVQWFKGQDKVEKSETIKSVKSGNTFKLDFKTVDVADAGQYTVKVIKDKKAISKYTASLTVTPS